MEAQVGEMQKLWDGVGQNGSQNIKSTFYDDKGSLLHWVILVFLQNVQVTHPKREMTGIKVLNDNGK